ncbi:DUF4123 domain-containing protein [Burkholderia sp. 3C]
MSEQNETGAAMQEDGVEVADATDAAEVMDVVEESPARLDDWPAFLESLHGGFAERSAQGLPLQLYAFLDSRGYPGLDARLAAAHGVRYASLWRETNLDAYPDIAPHLIAFDRQALATGSEQHRLLHELWTRLVDLHAVTWAWSPLPFDRLDAHCRQYVVYTLPGGRRFFLFFFDNHVLARLRQVWSDAQAQRFLAPFVALRYRDRWRKEVVWRNEAAVGADGGVIGSDSLVDLDDTQHARLIALGYPDKLALQFRETMAMSVDHLSDVELYEAIVLLLERAAGYGIADAAQVLSYVTIGVHVSPRFDEHPDVQACLAAVKRGEMDVDAALAGIGDAQWDAIRDAMELTRLGGAG